MQGKIIRLISNQYRVLLADKRIVDCIAMGKIRLDKAPLAGDLVEVEAYDDKYAIEHIYPRKNQLVRPPIANVDQAIIVMSAVEPDFSMTLVDQLIFLISCANIRPIIMISKMDLVTDMTNIQMIIDDYKMGGYQVVTTGKDERDQDVIAAILKDKITVLAGQSGVGKSSFLNRFNPEFTLVTQEISKALGRGKHTTRHVELHRVKDGWVADTPGFSKLDFSNLTKTQLANTVNDFIPYLGKCHFNDCLHDKEPGCAIKEAIEKGEVSKIRYLHYQQCLGYIEEKRKDIYD